MKGIRRLLSQPAFQIFLFCLFLILTLLPFMDFASPQGLVNMFDMGVFNYFFTLWFIFIILLFLISLNIGGRPGKFAKGHGGDV